MSQKIRTVRLYGKLGSAFGRVHRLAVASAAESIRALCVLLPGFERELMTSQDRGVGYVVLLGRRGLGQDDLQTPAGNDDIRIAPVLMGAKRGGLGQIILGAAVVAAAAWMAPATGGVSVAGYIEGAAASSGFLGLSGGYALAAQMGVAMALGGVAQMLTPTAKGLSTKDGPDNGASYNFNGAVNTTAQGNAVPLLYGEMFIGSATISAGIFAEDQA